MIQAQSHPLFFRCATMLLPVLLLIQSSLFASQQLLLFVLWLMDSVSLQNYSYHLFPLLSHPCLGSFFHEPRSYQPSSSSFQLSVSSFSNALIQFALRILHHLALLHSFNYGFHLHLQITKHQTLLSDLKYWNVPHSSSNQQAQHCSLKSVHRSCY